MQQSRRASPASGPRLTRVQIDQVFCVKCGERGMQINLISVETLSGFWSNVRSALLQASTPHTAPALTRHFDHSLPCGDRSSAFAAALPSTPQLGRSIVKYNTIDTAAEASIT